MEILLPPSRACDICKNRMNDVCIGGCVPGRKWEYFDPDMTRKIIPTLTLEEFRELNGKMKGEWLFIQLTKILEVVHGDEFGALANYPRGRRIPQNFKIQGVLLGSEE